MSALVETRQPIPQGISIANAKLPQVYESAKIALSECSRIDECKDWANKAEALASYARQADDDTLRKTADRIQARAIRRCGELLKEIESARGGNRGGGRPDNNGNQKDGIVPLVSRSSVARDAGLSERQQKTALRVASIPAQEFEAAVESDSPPTVTHLAEIGKKPAPQPLVELNGRSSLDFRLSTQGQGAIERMAKAAEEIEAGAVARGASAREREILKQRTYTIITWLHKLTEELEAL